MSEFKGTSRNGKVMVAIGASVFGVVLAAFLTFAIFGEAGAAVAVFALGGGGSVIVFLIGLSGILYAKKTVLQVFPDRIEFLNREKLFAKKRVIARYRDMRRFKAVYHKKNKFLEESGNIYFLLGEKKYCRIELERLDDAAWAILSKLFINQVDVTSEIK